MSGHENCLLYGPMKNRVKQKGRPGNDLDQLRRLPLIPQAPAATGDNGLVSSEYALWRRRTDMAPPRFWVSVVSRPDWLRMTLIRRYGTTCRPGITHTIDPALMSGSRDGMNQHTTGGLAAVLSKTEASGRMQDAADFDQSIHPRFPGLHGKQIE
jgi:hypothetical protein